MTGEKEESMRFELKSLSKEAIPRALEKARHYRLLNEPAEAQSICLDVLRVDPENQEAVVTLLLALTDQFNAGFAVQEAQDLLPRLRSEYGRAYYAGVICERRGKAWLNRGVPDCESAAYKYLREAMSWYEKAEAIRPPENDDATLRWNTCARIIMGNPRLTPKLEEHVEQPLE
jgi:hypothetical protein